MGADLYLHSVTDPARKEWEPKFEAAVKKRDAAWDAYEKKTKTKVNHPIFGDPLPDRLQAYQDEVDRCMDAMYPPEGYFRDSYNISSVAWALGFSWWADVIPLLDDEDLLYGENLQTFRRMVAVERPPDVTIRRLREGGAHIDDDPDAEDGANSWLRFFEEKRLRLLAFIDHAIALNEPIYCSL